MDGRILWANLHLLFRLSLVPFGTAWMGENEFAPVPTAAYGVILIMAAMAYYILVRALIAREGSESVIATAIGEDIKGLISPLLYAIAIPAALVLPWLSFGIYVFCSSGSSPTGGSNGGSGPETKHDHAAEATGSAEPHW